MKKLTLNDILIIQKPNSVNRFIVVQKNTNKVINDANGYGFTSKKKAKAAMAFLLNGGKERKAKIKAWWNQHENFAKDVELIIWYRVKGLFNR